MQDFFCTLPKAGSLEPAFVHFPVTSGTRLTGLLVSAFRTSIR
jgi:hypothetical protein